MKYKGRAPHKLQVYVLTRGFHFYYEYTERYCTVCKYTDTCVSFFGTGKVHP